MPQVSGYDAAEHDCVAAGVGITLKPSLAAAADSIVATPRGG